MSSVMNRTVYIALQCTWGILQNAAGAIVYLINKKCRHERFHGAVVTYIDKPGFGGIALGAFVFINEKGGDEYWLHDTRLHEYGHTVQSAVLGPIWLFVIALPSAVWANAPFCARARKRRGRSYYALYCERWANKAGKRACREGYIRESMRRYS